MERAGWLLEKNSENLVKMKLLVVRIIVSVVGWPVRSVRPCAVFAGLELILKRSGSIQGGVL